MNKSGIKLLYITQCYGGVGTYIRQVISYINTKEFTIEVIGPYDESFVSYCKEHKVNFHCVEMPRGLSIRKDIKSYIKIRKIAKKVNPDIIHLHSSKAGMIGRLATRGLKKKVVFTPHAISYMSFAGIKRVIFFLCELFAKRYTDEILVCSHSEAMRLHFEVGIPYDKMNVIQNSIPIPVSMPIKRNFDETDNIHIGSIMRLTTQKNPLIYIETANLLAKEYKNISFSILGAGMTDDLKPQIMRKIDEYDLSDKFTIINWGEHNESINYLDTVDIFILPSLFEALPLAALEAMSKGIPCIVSKDDGCRDLVDNAVNGFSCITPQQYYDATIKLIKDPNLRKDITQKAFNHINENHNIILFTDNLENYYKSLID